jgi:glutamate--cysteine ligase
MTATFTVEDLVARFHAASKPRADWRVGVEHEKFGVLSPSGAPIPYTGVIDKLLDGLAGFGWRPLREGAHVIALARGQERITLEPGGQVELSGAPLVRGHEIQDEVRRHLGELEQVARPLGVTWLGVGFHPFATRDEIPWVPKGRYVVMREVLAARGSHAHDMMKRTSTVQANLDWSDEEDAAHKMRASMGVTSLVTALFASSPLVEGRDSGYASFRARVWLDTDPDRCGILPLAFEEGDLFRRYAEWALDVPMLFFHRHGGGYRHAHGTTFRRFMREGLDGDQATLEDWDVHLSTLFPETRLKGYLEVRGADSGPLSMVLALPALWKGLLYDREACLAASALTAKLSFADRLTLRAEVPRMGLATMVAPLRATVGELARDLVTIAREGLERVSPEDLPWLEPLVEIAATGRAVSDRVRDQLAEAKGDRAKLIRSLSY